MVKLLYVSSNPCYFIGYDRLVSRDFRERTNYAKEREMWGKIEQDM